MGYNRMRSAVAITGVALIFCLAGCRTAPPASRGFETLSVGKDLDNRPLYTFNEAELGVYLSDLHQRIPDLKQRIIHLGRKNIGQPYELYLLGEFPYGKYDDDPIYCLSRSDCVTFSEHSFAAAMSDDWWSYLRTLQRIRYRDGIVSMVTRNHYTIADWIPNNSFLFEDITARLGEGKAAVPLHQVCKRTKFFKNKGVEVDIPDEVVADFYIPKENLPQVLGELQGADFVNIIRGNEKSQYAGHVGMIAIADDGTVDFLHSTPPTVREQPIMEYLNSSERHLGVKILRLRPDAERIMHDKLANSIEATPISAEAMNQVLADQLAKAPVYAKCQDLDWFRAMHLQAYRIRPDSPTDDGLQAELERIDAELGEQLGIPDSDRAIGVLDLTDLRLAMVNPDQMFYAASVPKICILLAYFETHPEAVKHLADDVRRELGRMIKVSDNAMAAKYGKLLGIDKVQEVLQSRPYRFYHKNWNGGFWYGKHYASKGERKGDPVHDYSHGATVRQCLRYYLMLEQGRLVNPQACERMKEIFASPELDYGNTKFVAGLNGRDVTMIRKSGTWRDWHADTARVEHGGRVYLLAGLTHHSQGGQYLTRAAAALDDYLCGKNQKPKPFAHELVLHESFKINAPGGNQSATVYESEVVAPELKFNEAVLSWNVDAPEGTGFYVETRVGQGDGDSWSPWLLIGEWNAERYLADPLTKCDEGYIDVDFFRSEKRFDRLQYRITGCGEESVRKIGIARVAVCVSDTTGKPVAIPRDTVEKEKLSPRYYQRRLPVPFRTQATDNPDWQGQLCSPTSTSAVMAYRGVDVPMEDVARRIYDNRHGIFGNWPNAVQAAYSFGVPGYIDRFSDWEKVEKCIAKGQPLVISIKAALGELKGAPYDYTNGHLIVLTGFDKDGHVEVNDCAVRKAEKGQIQYLREDLENVWMKTKGGTAYVLLPPE